MLHKTVQAGTFFLIESEIIEERYYYKGIELWRGKDGVVSDAFSLVRKHKYMCLLLQSMGPTLPNSRQDRLGLGTNLSYLVFILVVLAHVKERGNVLS